MNVDLVGSIKRKEKLDMKRTLSLAVALLIAGGLSALAYAAESGPVTITSEMNTSNLHMDELTAFGQLAQSNPKMARSLTANPRLANSRSFLKRNPGLANFFSKYPGSKDRFLSNPGNYLAGVHMSHGRLVSRHPSHKVMKKTEEKSKSEKLEKGASSESGAAANPAPGGASPPPAAGGAPGGAAGTSNPNP